MAISAALLPGPGRRLSGLRHPGVPAVATAITLAAAPHFLRIPVWIPIIYLALVGLRLATPLPRPGAKSANSFPIALLKLAVGAAIVGGVFASYGTLTGRDAGVALLILLAGMKLVEIRHDRDFYIASFIGLFLLLTNFFYRQSIVMGGYTAFCVLAFLWAFIALNDERRTVAPRARVRLSGALFVQALPLMLVLFILFPRVPGPLWGLPKDARAALSGLDEQMSPGAISQLTLSDAVAFRVEFDGSPPPRSELYWRGPVLWFTDGVKWVPDRRRNVLPEVETRGKPVRYAVTLEPTEKNWLYALELPASAPERAHFTEDLQIRTRAPVRNRVRYAVVSYPDHTLESTGPWELERALQLPPGWHPRALALAEKWRAAGLGAKQIVGRALDMFHRQSFFYTLTPPVLLNDTVDQFLFETRQGFCEHYAASFVVLMRGAGVPARVVTGYQGGTFNPVGGYLTVRQRDAHAWAEVWLGGEGWVRIDPTAAVAPERIRDGIDAALPQSILGVPSVLQDSAVARDLWERFGFTWDAINNRWNQWVLGYDHNRQSLVLNRMGLGWLNETGLLIGLCIALAGVLLIVAVWLFRGGPRQVDEARRLYDRFCRRLARKGLPRHSSEGPEDFARRAARRFPAQAAQIRHVTDLYLAVRYAGEAGKTPSLKKAVRALAT